MPFFNHPKATLPALPKLVKLTGARAVPILACYDEGEGLLAGDRGAVRPLSHRGSGSGRQPDEPHGGAAAWPPPSSTCGFSRSFETQEHDQGEDGLYELGIRRIRQGCH